MVSSAQIAYPTNDDEKEQDFPPEGPHDGGEKEPVEKPDDERTAQGLGTDEESCAKDDEKAVDPCDEFDTGAYVHRESGRRFDVSIEEFCADSYEQGEDVETRIELGRKGEEAAVKYLLSKGYEIIKRNWFCRFGEADIIARDPDGYLCFVEVKTRKSIEAGFPEEAITKDKRRRYERIALAFMMVSEDWSDNDNIRFDAIGICVTGPHRAMLRHHKGCFDASF